jgi:hypothetical protein
MNPERPKLSLAPRTATATPSSGRTAEKLDETASSWGTAGRKLDRAAPATETPEDRRRRMDEAIAAVFAENDAVFAELAKR